MCQAEIRSCGTACSPASGQEREEGETLDSSAGLDLVEMIKRFRSDVSLVRIFN